MSKSTTVTCKVCLEEMKGDVGLNFHNNDSTVYQKMLGIHLKTEVSIDENPVVCNKCNVETYNRMKNESSSEVPLIKNEIKEDLNEEIVEDKLVLFNTNIHSNMHTSIIEVKVEPPQSPDCGYPTENNTTLKSQESVRLIKCNKCNNCTHTNDCLSTNVVKCKKNQSVNFITSPDRCFSCHICDYITYNKLDLIEHRRIHKPYKCNLCNYCSDYLNCLKIHLCKHSGERPFRCDKCDYKTFAKTYFDQHQKTHVEEKLWKCNFCDYRCNHSEYLKRHMYKHSGNWPFMCDKCDYKTYAKYKMSQHEKKHTKEKSVKSNC